MTRRCRFFIMISAFSSIYYKYANHVSIIFVIYVDSGVIYLNQLLKQHQ